MDKQPLWKPLLIVAVILICALSMYPPREKLKPGLDLAGGTTLVYQVNVPDTVTDTEREINDTIAVLRSRVDPSGVRNLIWRPQAGHRIEIQMAQPQEGVVALRDAYIKAREALLGGNLSSSSLDALARSTGEGRATLLTSMSGGSAEELAKLTAFAEAEDKLAAARKPYADAEAVAKQIESELNKLPAEENSPKRAELTKKLQAQREVLFPLASAYTAANRASQAARSAMLQTNVSAPEIERILALPITPEGGPPKNSEHIEYREQALEKLLASTPARAAQIQAVAKAYTDYEKVKGPLDDPNDLITLLRGSGVLEFRVAPGPNALPDEQQYREQLRTRGPRGSATANYRWFQIDDISGFADNSRDRELLSKDTIGYFADRYRLIAQPYGAQVFVLLSNQPDASITESQPGWALSNAYATRDSSGFPAVSFELNQYGGQLMGALTSAHKGEPMAIVLDGRVMSAPNINDKITSSGIITGGRGGFAQKELDYLVRTLKAGSLKARLSENPISIQKIGPQFGEDNLKNGLRAAIYSFAFVCVLMGVYYFVGGLVANIALTLNLVILLGVMSTIEATFTLPGIAGVILTIGMAVDANVLIFERIREELERGAQIKTAIRIGYSKAMSSIVDSNITSIITCAILYYVGTADIKGFGLTLGIGLVASMFTAVFVSRVLLEYYVAIFKPRTLNMLPIAMPAIRKWLTPNIDWVGNRFIFFGISIFFFVISIVALVARGKDFLDIEFRSGTQVTFNLATGKTLSVSDVQQRLDKAAEASGLKSLGGKEATVLSVGTTEFREGKTYASTFTVATLAGGENVPGNDANAVSDAIKATFADVLDVQQVIAFTGSEKETVIGAPVYLLKTADVASAIGRPEVTAKAPDYIGGVAIVIDNISPAQPIDGQQGLRARINSLRFSPRYDQLGYRQFEVIPIEAASHDAASNLTLYKSVAIVSRDEQTNYNESPDSFADKNGLADTEWALIKDSLQRDVSLASVSNFSSQVSGTMTQQAIVAVVLSWLVIMAYVWIRFGDLRFGIGAVVALIHDVVIAVGFTALSYYIAGTTIGQYLDVTPFRLNLALIASALTLIGFSVNDTIVIFDRIRENRGRLAHVSKAMINDSINQTFSRTILTSGTTFVATLVLFYVGGEGVHGFAFVFLIGVVAGSYSTIAIASPLLLLWHKKDEPVIEEYPPARVTGK